MQPFDVNNIFAVGPDRFEQLSLEIFQYQYHNNAAYRSWSDLMGCSPDAVKTLTSIPALPISLFKSHQVLVGDQVPETFFESSGTTQTGNSRHWVLDLAVYQQSFMRGFEGAYGAPSNWCVLALLPAYLERQHSSLVYMAEALTKASGHASSGFYLYDHEKLSATLQQLEASQQSVLLIGVSFALLDFAAAFPQQLKHTLVMETGGMKGRRKELTREELHEELKAGLGIHTIHSEYGMTELLSQAYSKGGGRYQCPPWMKVLVRDEEDPLQLHTAGRGMLQVIDLANVYSCAFIATEDVGMVHADGSFEVWGRLDNSDIRGCSLLVV